MPTIDAVPPLIVGGILTGALIVNRQYDLLFGTWMCLYGLANLSCRLTLPGALWPLGIFYVACGTVCLWAPWIRLTNPWPMGIVFGAGELMGGFIFHRNRISHAATASFLNSQVSADE